MAINELIFEQVLSKLKRCKENVSEQVHTLKHNLTINKQKKNNKQD